MKSVLLILAASFGFGQCPTVDSNGVCILPISAIQNNLLGPLTPINTSPWIYGDIAEPGTAGYMTSQALSNTPALGTALAGTFSFSGGNTLTTTSDLRTPLAGISYIAVAWNSVDGPGTGRLICPISSVTSTTVVCGENEFEPSFSGVTGYIMSLTPDANGCNFTCWTTENPSTVWNYYDVAIALYRLYWRTNNSAYLTTARQYADIQWQWVLDHGYRSVAPRAGAMISQFYRAGEGHSERLPGLYNWISIIVPGFAEYGDRREAGYTLWDVALGAKVETDPTRHAQYCSWLGTYVPFWNSIQNSDGSWGENEYAINTSYISAPKSFTPPFQYQGAPWRQAINVKSLEASQESLADTSSQGCNNPTLAATTLTTVTNAVTWQWNYGRDTTNRGIFYEVNSQSNDQATQSGEGTLATTLTSTAVVGTGTTFVTDGICDGTHFIGIQNPRTVYKIASCADNTHLTLTVAFGLYSESSNETATPWGWAPAASSSCGGSLASYCFLGAGSGDRNLTRTLPGGIGWLYAKTLNATYKTWGDELFSANLGGPTAGLTTGTNLGSFDLPCSGPACDGLVTDNIASAEHCNNTMPPGTPPCAYGVFAGNLGKNYGEAWGAPGIDNYLAWRLSSVGPGPCSVSPSTLGPWTNTQVISQTMTTTCSGGTITWTSSGLPTGLSGCNGVTGSSCVLSGTLSAVGLYSAMITATASNTASVSPSIVVNVVPSIATTVLPNATSGMAYSQSLSVNGGTSPLTCSVSSGTLAGSGLTLNPSSCALTGTPTSTVATYSFTARVTDANGINATQPLTVSVTGSPCDLNGDGIVNVQDTQLAVNMSLSIIPCTANINGANVCNSVTISRVVTASLGGSCQVGP